MEDGVNGPRGVIAHTHVMLVLKLDTGHVITQRMHIQFVFYKNLIKTRFFPSFLHSRCKQLIITKIKTVTPCKILNYSEKNWWLQHYMLQSVCS